MNTVLRITIWDCKNAMNWWKRLTKEDKNLICARVDHRIGQTPITISEITLIWIKEGKPSS